MSLTPASKAIDPVSKVTFSPVSDGKTDALIVTIETVVPEGQEAVKVMEGEKDTLKVIQTPRRSSSYDSKRKTRSSRTPTSKSSSKSATTEKSKKSFASQTSVEIPVPSTSTAQPASLSSSPCLKHAAENISRKASQIPSEKVSLCNNCSKSMLSYIFIVQDFLESLAKEICGNADSQNCVQCMRHETRQSLSSQVDAPVSTSTSEKKSSKIRDRNKDGHKSESSRTEGSKSSHPRDHRRDTKTYEESRRQDTHQAVSSKVSHGTSEDHRRHPDESSQQDAHHPTHEGNQREGHHRRHGVQHRHHEGDGQQDGHHQKHFEGGQQVHHSGDVHHGGNRNDGSGAQNQPSAPYHGHQGDSSHQSREQNNAFRKPIERQQPDFMDEFQQDLQQGGDGSEPPSFPHLESLSSPFDREVDGIVSTLSNVEREVYDAARNGAGWDSLAEPQERLISSSSNRIPSEAFVTMCRNNAEALGCLVVGTSLLLSRTSRTLCVVVSDGVSNAFRGPLSTVFHVVQCVRAMDSLGTTKLALLEQPELGISFEKLNVWRLVQFNKCVFLNPDTLVTQNIDELFCRDELSATPDIGWPDCFNSGVFVFVPSIQTFWQLVEFAEKQGSYDGGDQGLLNAYFNSWSDDISKKLSFIYNLMANVSYTYTPAFKQFGRNVKIVQFHGSFKPWHVKFFGRTGQISPASTVHPTYVQFVHIWINIFRISALRQLSQEIQSYANTQEVICAVELLRFFPLPTESEAEFYLTPPSVRLRLAERKLQKSTKSIEEIQRRKSAEFSHAARIEDEPRDSPSTQQQAQDTDIPRDTSETSDNEVSSTSEETGLDTASSQDPESSVKKDLPVDENALPGAEVGNYQGMKAWEQGRMDYQGTDSSDNIMKRLEFLMAQPK